MTTHSHVKHLNSLEHHLLVAMPSMDDGYFEKTVIYIVEDNDSGTMGLILNLPNEQMTVGELLHHFKYPIVEALPYFDDPVFVGGPVDPERGFILHRPLGNWQTTLPLSDRLGMTVSEDLLKAMAAGKAPEDFIICLGYAGWTKGQLAEELQQNSWLTLPYNESLLFDIPAERKWHTALGTLGITPEFLSMEAGHA